MRNILTIKHTHIYTPINLHDEGLIQDQFLKRSLIGSNSEFSFS